MPGDDQNRRLACQVNDQNRSFRLTRSRELTNSSREIKLKRNGSQIMEAPHYTGDISSAGQGQVK